ncbi:MAG: hypothetical protein R3E79_62260 [Caldilineaceae bacterium]
MIEAGLRASGSIINVSLQHTAFQQVAQRFFTQYDLLLTPQMPVGAWPVDQPPATIEGKPTPSMFDRLSFLSLQHDRLQRRPVSPAALPVRAGVALQIVRALA